VSALETQMQVFKQKKKGRWCLTFINTDPTSFKLRPRWIYRQYVRGGNENSALTVVGATYSFYITTIIQAQIAAVQQFAAACIV